MRTYRFAIAGVALVASTILISCGSDDDDAPANSVAPGETSSTISSLPIAETTIAITDSTLENSTDSTVDDSAETTLP